MSRIGRAPITIPSGVDVKLDGTHIIVKGKGGTLERDLHPAIKVTVDGSTILVERPSDHKDHRSLHGLTRTLINNMVIGVNDGFKKELEINGVGYRATKQGKDLVMNLGYSHQVIVSEIDGISISVEGNKVTIAGPDKQKVGQFASEVRGKRPPEPYKGKGIKYSTERIIRKEGKAGKGAKK